MPGSRPASALPTQSVEPWRIRRKVVTPSLKLVIFGLSISSSWGNGHATLWRALCRALGRRGHRVVFFEKDVPYYASHRDMTDIPGCHLRLYSDWNEIAEEARRELADADVGMV